MHKESKQQTDAAPRIDCIDLLKSLAIYWVIIYHFDSLPVQFIQENNIWFYFNYFIKSLLSACVPIFFFVNGILLFKKNSLDLQAHIYKIIKIVILTVIWSLLTMVVLSLLHGKPLSPRMMLKYMWVLQHGWNDHLWFLKVLTVIYIFYPLLYIAYRTYGNVFYFFFVCVVLFTFGNTLIGDCATAVSFFTHTYMDSHLRINYWAGFNPFKGVQEYAIGYFMLGGIMYRYQEVFRTRKFKMIAAIALLLSTTLLFLFGVIASWRTHVIWDVVWNGYNTFFTLINVIALFILLLNYQVQGKIGKWITIIGKNSLGIYLTHKIILNCFGFLYSQTEWTTTLFANMIYAGLVLLCSLLFVLFLKKIPIVKYLFIT